MILTKGQLNLKLWIAALACLVLGGALFGSGYWLGQRSLQSQLKTLTAEVANAHRLPGNIWPGANAMHPPMPFTPGANIPANASPELKEFLQNRQTLMQKMAELRQQNPSANGAPDPKLFAEFQEQNAALLQRQKELSQIIGQQLAKNPIPTPPPLQIPPNASPQLQAYLTARDQLMRDQIAFMNQHRTDDPATRQAAMQQWRQQNATRFQQLQQQAQAMAQTPSPTPTTPITPTSTTTK
jgi:hypothetical protein